MRTSVRTGLMLLCCLVLSTAVCGCRLWDRDAPGGKSAGWGGGLPFASIPTQSEPAVDADFDDTNRR